MKYAADMDSDATIYIYTTFHKDWYRHSKVMGRGDTRHTDSMEITSNKNRTLQIISASINRE
jgi:hypothetical protein